MMNQELKQSAVAGFLPSLECDRFSYHRIAVCLCEGTDHHARLTLGIEGLFPEGNSPQALKSCAIKLWPRELLRLILQVALHEASAKQFLVSFRSDFHWPDPCLENFSNYSRSWSLPIQSQLLIFLLKYGSANE